MKYVGKKIITMIITLLFVSLLVFFSFEFISGDPALSKLGMNATPEAVEALREEMGLNKSLLVRYGAWILGVLQGDLGTSYSYGIPVTAMIADKIPITIVLTLMAFIMVVLLAVPLGIYCAKKEGSVIDRIIIIFSQITMAVPPFFAGILLTYLFGLVLHWFTPGGFVSYEVNLGAFLSYLVFPAIAIALPKIAMSVKLLRSSILEQAKADYVRTAFSKGNNTKKVLYHHILKNALIPTITFLGMLLADMAAGSIIIEQVFGIPGIGRILLTSISNRDYPMVQGVILFLAAFVVVINFFVDILYRIIDPRMKQIG